MTNAALWLWLPALGALILALYLGEGKTLTVTSCISQFPLIAFGMATLVVCVLSPRVPLSRVRVPGAAFIASSHKLILHQGIVFCSSRGLELTSATGLFLVQLAIYAAGALLFFAVERPFLQLRHRLTGDKIATAKC